MVIAALLVLGGIAAVWALRRRRKAVLAGLHADKPVFMSAPRTRTLLSRKDHRW